MEGQLTLYKKRLAIEIKNIPEEYIPNLIQIVRLFRESVSLKPAEESFRQGWKEGLSGETHPLTGLWDGIDADWRCIFWNRFSAFSGLT